MASNARNLSRILGGSPTIRLSTLPEESLSGGGVTQVTSEINLPVSGNTNGDMIFVETSKALYVWDGTEWDRVYSGLEIGPKWITEPENLYNLNLDGSSTTITVSASDPEGFPIAYSYDTDTPNQTQCTIHESNGTFTLTPSTNENDEGSFSLRLIANDGLRYLSKTSTISLIFTYPITFNTEISERDANFIASNDFLGTVYASQSVGAAASVVRSDALRLGRVYFEVQTSNTQTWTMQFGLTINRTVYHTTGPGVWTVYDDRSVVYPGNLSSYDGVSLNFSRPISRYMVAYDTDTREVWFGTNGSWFNGKNPNLGDPGFPLTGNPGDPVYTYSNTYYDQPELELTFHRSDTLLYDIPTGFNSH